MKFLVLYHFLFFYFFINHWVFAYGKSCKYKTGLRLIWEKKTTESQQNFILIHSDSEMTQKGYWFGRVLTSGVTMLHVSHVANRYLEE